MHSTKFLTVAALSSVAIAQVALPIPTEDAQALESLIQGAIPSEYKTLIPSVCPPQPHFLPRGRAKVQSAATNPSLVSQETQVVDALAAYVTSVTAAPEFFSAIAALETAVPLSAVAAIGANPEDFIMELATGTIPSWFTAIPSSVIDYVESIGEQALSLVEAGTGISALPDGAVSEVEASATAAYAGAQIGAYGIYATGGYAHPTGTGYGGYAHPTGTGAYYPYPTGSGVSGGFAAPTGNSSVVPYSPSPIPEVFPGAASPRNIAVGAAAVVAGVVAVLAL